MLILVTNDDGIESAGLHAIARELRRLGRVVMAAPAAVKSAVSHSITLHRPLRVRKSRKAGLPAYVVDGTPADCVKLALHELLPRRPDLVVSGINFGLNTGHNVLYSGTVAGALEASMHGITSFAVSLESARRMDFESAARLVSPVIRRVFREYRRTRIVFNINVPAIPAARIRGIQVCIHEQTPFRDRYVRRRDPRGQSYYWLKPERTRDLVRRNGAALSDAVAVAGGYISVSPLKRDLTHHEGVEELRGALGISVSTADSARPRPSDARRSRAPRL
jgi:5'-nucleotidase